GMGLAPVTPGLGSGGGPPGDMTAPGGGGPPPGMVPPPNGPVPGGPPAGKGGPPPNFPMGGGAPPPPSGVGGFDSPQAGGMFPGAGGVPGGQGSLQPGGTSAPPAGAATRPHLAFKIDPYYAFAFDSERNEFYTVGMRIEKNRGLGTLRRYSYPDFKLKEEFNLPNFGTRMALDAKKGVLYLAAATNQASATLGQLWSDGYDRAHGYG